MTTAPRAHPNLSVLCPERSRDDIARLYSEEHAAVWALVRRESRAEGLPPPVLRVETAVFETPVGRLVAEGVEPIEPGWLPTSAPARRELARRFPNAPEAVRAAAGQPASVQGVELVAGPAAPPGLTEGTLVTRMVERGYGRPSTYANQVKKARELVERGVLTLPDGRHFGVGEEGRRLLALLDRPDLPRLDASYSAELEGDLSRIERGEVEAEEVVRRHLSRLPPRPRAPSARAPADLARAAERWYPLPRGG